MSLSLIQSLRPVLRVSRVGSARPSTRKSSTLSVASSVVGTSSLGSSLLSLVPDAKDRGDVMVSNEECETLSTGESEADPPISECRSQTSYFDLWLVTVVK